MEEQLIETWAIHNRIHLYMLKAISDEALGDTLDGKGRSVYQLFAHIHNVRLMWIQSAAPTLLNGLEKVESTDSDRAKLVAALEASGKGIEGLLRNSLAAGGKIKGFKPHVVAFLGYLISH